MRKLCIFIFNICKGEVSSNLDYHFNFIKKTIFSFENRMLDVII
jgi:hypothetical protein